MQMYEKLGNDLDSAYNKYAGVSPRKPDDAAMAENLVDATKSIYNYVSLDYVSQACAALCAVLSRLFAYGKLRPYDCKPDISRDRISIT
jgi:hypothetical protein